jgi:hypothetical protein
MDIVLPSVFVHDARDESCLIVAATCQEGVDEDDNELAVTIPYLPFGAIFLNPLLLNEVPCIKGRDLPLPDGAFRCLFGIPREKFAFH